jgi:outer membrane protein assembly factor BamD
MLRTFSLILIVALTVSCKTEFEKIRSNPDPNAILASGHEYFEQGKYYNAQLLYEQVIPFFRGKAEAEDLFYNYAYTHYNLGDFILSSHYFKSFATSFYNSDKKEECDYMSAYSNYKLSPTSTLDQSYSRKAIDAFQTFINSYPNSERNEDCNALIDELRAKMETKAFAEGNLYYDLKQYNSAIYSFENMLKDYPASKKSEEVRFLIIKAGYEYANKSIYNKKAERFDLVLENIKTFQKKYPKSKFNKEIRSMRKDSDEKYIKYKS